MERKCGAEPVSQNSAIAALQVDQAYHGNAVDFDAQVTTYGLKLREWISMQVEAHLQLVIPGHIERALAARLSSGGIPAAAATARCGGALGSVASPERVRRCAGEADADAHRAEFTELKRRFDQLYGTVSELSRWRDPVDITVSALKRAHDEADVGDLARWKQRQVALLADLSHRQEELGCWKEEAKMQLPELRRRQDRQEEAALELQLEFRREVESLSDSSAQLRRQFAAAAGSWEETASAVATAAAAAAAVAPAQQRLLAEVRSGSRGQTAALAALDEQLWLTEQRLGRRIDDLTAAHKSISAAVTAGAAAVAASAGGVMGAHALPAHSHSPVAPASSLAPLGMSSSPRRSPRRGTPRCSHSSSPSQPVGRSALRKVTGSDSSRAVLDTLVDDLSGLRLAGSGTPSMTCPYMDDYLAPPRLGSSSLAGDGLAVASPCAAGSSAKAPGSLTRSSAAAADAADTSGSSSSSTAVAGAAGVTGPTI